METNEHLELEILGSERSHYACNEAYLVMGVDRAYFQYPEYTVFEWKTKKQWKFPCPFSAIQSLHLSSSLCSQSTKRNICCERFVEKRAFV
jgi:hypothetical protein